MADVACRLQVAQLAVQSQESVLGQLLGIFPPSGQPQGQTEDPRLMVADQPDKGRGFAPTGRDEVAIRGLT